MGSWKQLLVLLLVATSAAAFLVRPPLPRACDLHQEQRVFFPNHEETTNGIQHSVSTRNVLSATANKGGEGDLIEKLGPLRFLVPLGFVAQICFLVAAKLLCGLENLKEYGRIGNEYIAAHRYENMPILENYQIQSQGQKIWYNNVIRDLQNGGPVKPPITEP